MQLAAARIVAVVLMGGVFASVAEAAIIRGSGTFEVELDGDRDFGFLANRRFYQGFLIFQGNDELGLDLRTAVGGGFGTYLVQDTRQEWAVVAGLAVTRENFATQDISESLEAVLGTGYSFFRFKTSTRASSCCPA